MRVMVMKREGEGEGEREQRNEEWLLPGKGCGAV